MQAKLELTAAQWQVLPLTIDPADFVNFQRPPLAASGVPAPRIGYLARLAPEKGLHVLAEAFIELAKRDANVRLEIAGWLGKQQHEYWQAIEQRFASAGVSDRVHYWGSVDRGGKLEFLRNIDVLSVPATHFEPKGLFVLEALAAGVPVVLPDHAAFPELIERLGGGYLVAPEDPVALADRLQNVLADLPAARALGAQGREQVLQHSTTAHEARRLAEILQQLEHPTA
jgi:glycosyltransferase involved in cell wall biosynthesis